MDDQTLNDLTQFISTTTARQLALQTEDLRSDIGRVDIKIDGVEQRLTKKIGDLSDAVSEALETSNSATAKQLQNHETRLVKLEAKPA